MAQEAQNGDGTAAETVETPKASVIFTAVKPQRFVTSPKANDAVQFFKAAFGAEEVTRVNHPKRKAEQELPLILSVELKLGSSSFIVSDLIDEVSSAPVNTCGSVFCLETEDVGAAVAKAVSAGAVSEGEIGEGDCCVANIKDPYGNVWKICSPVVKKCELSCAAPLSSCC